MEIRSPPARSAASNSAIVLAGKSGRATIICGTSVTRPMVAKLSSTL